jgi:hypothetical protein
LIIEGGGREVTGALYTAEFQDDRFHVARYCKVPLNLYCLSLRICEKNVAEKKGLLKYDYEVSSRGLIEPSPVSNTFVGFNGLSLKPSGRFLFELVALGRRNSRVIEVPEGTEIPGDLILLHDGDDFYSLQPTLPMKPTKFIATI